MESRTELIILKHQVVFNDLVLRTIFKYLSAQDLLWCRQVHPLWLQEGTKILHKKACFQEVYVSTEISDVNNNALRRTNFKIEDLTQLLKSSQSFPCSNFRVAATYWDGVTIQDFFHYGGKHIEQICFDFCNNCSWSQEIVETVQRILVEQLPNLNTLALENTSKNSSKICDSLSKSCQKSLQSLKTLKLTSQFIPPPFLEWILHSTPNLTAIKNPTGEYHEEFLNLAVRLKQVGFIKEISLTGKNIEKRLSLYSELAHQGLYLDSISKLDLSTVGKQNCKSLSQKIANSINRCLESSSKTLRTIEGCYALSLFPGLVLPSLPNLRTLEICYRNGDSSKFFPSMTNLAKMFPRLTNLVLNFGDEVLYFKNPSQVFFDTDDDGFCPLLSVTSLSFVPIKRSRAPIVVAILPTVWLRYLSKLFPNVTRLSLPTFKASSFEYASQIVWRSLGFVQLTQLQIGIYFSGSGASATYLKSRLQVDAGFTGFSQRSCLELYNQLNSTNFDTTDLDLDGLRINPSILDLKSLRKLEINFQFSSGFKHELKDTPISILCSRFAFEKNSRLAVDISTNMPH